MKLTHVAIVLAAVSVVCGSDFESSAKSHVIAGGTIGPNDFLLHRSVAMAFAVPNEVQTQDVVYNHIDVVITAFRAAEIGAHQNATVTIVTGGITWQEMNMRFQSQAGRGYHYQFEIWGRLRRG